MALIEMRHITRSYRVAEDEIQVLHGIDVSIEEGEFVAIMGASGSGKSTLMQIMGLLDRPTAGDYRLAGHRVSQLSDDQTAALRSSEIGFVFQMFNLLARTSALDNVLLPMVYAGQNHRDERARRLLSDVGLDDRLDHKPNQLSGGQQQRVAIARALANTPRIVFADEPTGNLASDQADEILARLWRLNRSGTTVVMVTHEPDIASYAGRILHLKDGRIVSDEPNRTPTAPSPAALAMAAPQAAVPVMARRPTVPAAPRFTWVELREHVRSALRAMTLNKARSGLSVLGILIGVAAVITMLAIGRGAQKAIEARLQSLGSNVLMMFAGSPSTRGIRGAAGSFTRLTLDDARAIRKIPSIVDMYPEVEGQNVRVVYKNQNTSTEVQGVPVSYAAIRNAMPTQGRFFTDEEDRDLARVAVVGQTVVNNIFGDEDPLGKTIKIRRDSFRVIGILPPRGSSGGFSDQDDMIIIPLHTGMKRLLGTIYLHEMAIQCASLESIPQVIADVTRLMRRRHRLPAFKEDDFTLRNNADVQAALSGTTQTLSSLLGIVAAISLLVGGVGVMNIMLVSVNERTREIGLRKAIGATRRAILIQFLLEATLLSLVGGVMGIGLGVLVSLGLSAFAGWIAILTLPSVLLSFVFSASVGIVFGFWPAHKASLLSPIEALRYE